MTHQPPAKVNSSFSTKLPSLQLGIDSTSLGTFKECPRKYQLSIIQGWEPQRQSVHLTFGILLHQARESYDHSRAKGASHEQALEATMKNLLLVTWNKEMKRPWLSEDPNKNRLSLLRTVVWYLDTLGESDPIETLIKSDGRPAVELSFRFDSGIKAASTGETFIFCGHLDRLGTLNSQHFVVDIKTTASQLNPHFFNSFTPGNQFSMYALAGKVAFGQEIHGVIVDGIQVGAGFSRFQRGLVPRTDGMLEEWLADSEVWLRQLDLAAEWGHWPQNDKSCGLYGGCPFRQVCGRPPGKAREDFLKANFVRRVWDPLQSRGEV